MRWNEQRRIIEESETESGTRAEDVGIEDASSYGRVEASSSVHHGDEALYHYMAYHKRRATLINWFLFPFLCFTGNQRSQRKVHMVEGREELMLHR